jgi:hypothetical protein
MFRAQGGVSNRSEPLAYFGPRVRAGGFRRTVFTNDVSPFSLAVHEWSALRPLLFESVSVSNQGQLQRAALVQSSSSGGI